ncbi:phosphoribosylglycinamide formyltransferase [Chitinivibrio alkaliphilus]|uniref:Phosphoribosylglycinamide formyltransferase n=1 Tax=Chitinivibrio alkaliphilus ACht1 TaxID=1313304 RepID=U7D3R2_9BACT|nr:phosphoribosylglycinamide formyltransferase [Chitinivibrio alkaliphilus]ERP31144.1 phosphoribosylglycinamide formyltransferase [Chitinivibrio alkaliphilus ACht1]
MNIAVFASGGGSNFAALITEKLRRDLTYTPRLLVSNNSQCGAMEIARNQAIPTLHIAPSHYSTPEAYAHALLRELENTGIECIVLAGYMKRIPEPVIAAYPQRILNIHPSLLPSFGGKGMYGGRIHEAVISRGVKITGITIHFVTSDYDEGPIIRQEPVFVEDTDTVQSLAQRVLAKEHAIYWKAVEDVAQEQLVVENGRVYRHE